LATQPSIRDFYMNQPVLGFMCYKKAGREGPHPMPKQAILLDRRDRAAAGAGPRRSGRAPGHYPGSTMGCEFKRRLGGAPYPISPISAIQQNSLASSAMHKNTATSPDPPSTVS
jgi:hypothetical protein